jgi:hypothetical protein
MKLISAIDLFGERVKLRVGKKDVQNSSVGGFFTIIMLILILTFTWLIGKDIIYKERPLSYQQSLIKENYPSIPVNRTLFPFGLSVLDAYGTYLTNSSIFKIEVGYYKWQTGTSIYKFIPLELETCTPGHFPQLAESQLPNIRFFQCLKDTANLSIAGA